MSRLLLIQVVLRIAVPRSLGGPLQQTQCLLDLQWGSRSFGEAPRMNPRSPPHCPTWLRRTNGHNQCKIGTVCGPQQRPRDLRLRSAWSYHVLGNFSPTGLSTTHAGPQARLQVAVCRRQKAATSPGQSPRRPASRTTPTSVFPYTCGSPVTLPCVVSTVLRQLLSLYDRQSAMSAHEGNTALRRKRALAEVAPEVQRPALRGSDGREGVGVPRFYAGQQGQCGGMRGLSEILAHCRARGKGRIGQGGFGDWSC